jgi:hypothetical protein
MLTQTRARVHAALVRPGAGKSTVDELTASINWGAKVFARFKFMADMPAALLVTVATRVTNHLVEAVSGHRLCRP